VKRIFSCCTYTNDRIQKINSEGERKIEMELDVVKIVSDLRKLSIVFEEKLAKDDTVFEIESSRRSLIFLDSSDESNGI
jgi:hypothetical protein